MLSSFVPFPDAYHSGGTDLFCYLDFLSEKYAIDLIALQHTSLEFQPLKKRCTLKIIPVKERSFFDKISPRILNPAYPKAFWTAYTGKFKNSVRKAISRKKYDVVWIEDVSMLQYLPLIPSDTEIVLNLMDITFITHFREIVKFLDSKKSRGLSNSGNGKWLGNISYWLRWLEWFKLFYWYTRAMERVDLVFCKNNKDVSLLKPWFPDNRMAVLPPYFDQNKGSLQIRTLPVRNLQGKDEPLKLLFFGNLHRQANIDSVNYTIDQILPILREKKINFLFNIVGAECSSENKNKWSNISDVNFIGFVEDYAPYFNEAHMFISPLLIGGGIIVKILQAMEAGLPVFTTMYGNEGIEAPDSCIVVKNSPEEIADTMVDMIDEPERFSAMSEQARNYIITHFSSDEIKKCLFQGFEQLQK